MRDLLSKARTRVGAAVIGASLLAVGGTATAAVVVTSPAADQTPAEVSTVSGGESTSSSQAAPSSAAPSNSPQPTAVEAPVSVAAVPTIGSVTEPAAQTPAAQPDGEVDPASTGVGTTGTDGRYTPAPPSPRAGEPPVLPDPGGAPAEKLPGEAGYVPPTSNG